MSNDLDLPISLPPALTKKLVDGNEIRVFSDANLQKQVEKALAFMPADHRVGVVAHADLNGASLSIIGKIGNNFTVLASGYRSWDGELKAEAELRYSL